jgi:hypothetical protein
VNFINGIVTATRTGARHQVAGSEDQAERLIADLVVQLGLGASTAAWLPFFPNPAEFGVLRA